MPTNTPQADQTLNAASEGGNDGAVKVRHDRERVRLETILWLLGEPESVQTDAAVKLDHAIAAHPDGVLTLTHGPVDEPSADFKPTFQTLVAMWWQDREDYGAVYNELLWSRQ
jgi:hypothetical protein